MKKFLATLGIVGLMGLNVGQVFAAAPHPALVSSVTANTGSTSGGDTVTISGAHFKLGAPSAVNAVTSVTFGGAPASFTVVNNSTLTVTTPAHAAGAVDVVVTNTDGSGTLVNGFTYVAPTTLVSSITVTGAGNATTIETDNGTLQMSAAVLPLDATDSSVTWSVTPGTGSATINASGLLSAITDGTVTVTATANDASGVTGTLVITISNQTAPAVPVTSITVTGAGDATTIETLGGTLQMSAAVLPENASDSTITWSVTPGTGSASINASGLLTAITDGTVTVTATANDGSGVTGTLVITISNQVPPVEPAACNESTFDGFSLGTVNGQGGWSSTGSFDQAVVENTYGYATFGCKTLRISDAITSGSFGDQTFTPSDADEAGETDALNNGFSGGTRKNHFVAQFDLASTMPTEQSGMHLSVSPDRGDGARMSYLRFEDHSADDQYTESTAISGHPAGSNYDEGINVFFDDVQGTTNPANFVETKIATLDRTSAHTVKFDMSFVDGPSNDVVKIYIDGVLVHTGTSWENYYRFDSESNPELVSNSRTVDSLLFRESGTATPANSGNGYLLDNFSEAVTQVVSNDPPVITLVGPSPLLLTIGYEGYVDPMATATDTEDGDISASVTASGPIDTSVLGSQTITYSVTDSDNNTATTTRIVTIIPQAGGAGGPNGVPGCRNPQATNYDPTAIYDGPCTFAPSGQVLGASTSTVPTTGSVGEVLGVSTSTTPLSCSEYLVLNKGITKKALRQGAKNDPEVVKLLQRFLNENISPNLPVTGFFGSLTGAAVKKLQMAHKETILSPWNLTTPTGIVYLTTAAHINNAKCGTLNIKVDPKDLIPATN